MVLLSNIIQVDQHALVAPLGCALLLALSLPLAMDNEPQDLTRLLQSGASQGELLPLVYDELMVLAKQRMSRERETHTLQATALVHEAYMKLAGDRSVQWRERGHFFGAAAESMRRILVDHARRVSSEKRGGAARRVTLGAADAPLEMDVDEALELHEALQLLGEEDPQAAEVTRLRFFAGLSMEQVAEALELSVRSVYREWSYARARLSELLEGGA